MNEEHLMGLAIAEASRGTRLVRPNPRVGAALLSKQGQMALGHHEVAGGPHAEINVLLNCKTQGIDPKGATMAVTLEPCSHFGKTPPCVDALIAAGIQRVLVGSRDPSPKVGGKGIAKLKAAGIDVVVGVMEPECRLLNEAWLTAEAQGFPFVRIKMATSMDGRWRSEKGQSQWITGPEARQAGHLLRTQSDVLVTGMGTVRADNPSLTARKSDGPLESNQPKVVVLTGTDAGRDPTWKIHQHPGGVRFLAGQAGLKPLLQGFLDEGIHELLLEAGPRLTASFLDEGLMNEIHLYMGSRFLGGSFGLSALKDGLLPGFETTVQSTRLLGSDLEVILRKL